MYFEFAFMYFEEYHIINIGTQTFPSFLDVHLLIELEIELQLS